MGLFFQRIRHLRSTCVKQGLLHRPWIGLIVLAILSLLLRFWQLKRFNHLVFDEVYFANFANSYLQGNAPDDAHPPLGKYIIAAGIWLGDWLNDGRLTGGAIAPEIGLSPLSYRQANALVGSLLPLLVVGIAYQIGHRLSAPRRWIFSLLSGLFVAIDGLFITESRYALLNIHMAFFGLLGHWLWLWARFLPEEQARKQVFWRLLAGVALGSAIAIKWNSLGFLLSLILWEMWLWWDRHFACPYPNGRDVHSTRGFWHSAKDLEWEAIQKSEHSRNFIFLIFVPTLTYCLFWWPHLHITQERFLSLHIRLFSFHQQIGAGGHAACSKWFTWPLLVKPITYWYEKIGAQSYTVNNLGNPALWLFSSSAVCLLLVYTLSRLKSRLSHHTSIYLPNKREPVGAYLLISYMANWLPWMWVERCTFNYLYMPAAVYSFMTLAWLLSEWLRSVSKVTRIAAWICLGLIAISFLFWLPLALGLPLSPRSLQIRWWLKSWI